MTQLLHAHDGAAMARILRSLADDLEEGTRPKGNITRANSWYGNLRGTSFDAGPRGSDGTSPTEAVATARTHWTSHLAGDIATAARKAVQHATLCANLVARIPAPVEADELDAQGERDRLADENIGAGDCEVCGHRCEGRDGDRRRTIGKWSVWVHGELVEHDHERKACDACRVDWDRKRAADPHIDFDDWARHRAHRREREAS